MKPQLEKDCVLCSSEEIEAKKKWAIETKDIDFSEEIDEDSVFKELDGETEHISAIFDAMHDKQAQKNTVKVEIIEDKSENIILSDNKSDEQRPNLNNVNNPVHN